MNTLDGRKIEVAEISDNTMVLHNLARSAKSLLDHTMEICALTVGIVNTAAGPTPPYPKTTSEGHRDFGGLYGEIDESIREIGAWLEAIRNELSRL